MRQGYGASQSPFIRPTTQEQSSPSWDAVVDIGELCRNPSLVSAPDLDRSTAGQLQAFVGDLDHVSFLLGAGASASVGLPDWDTLAVQLLVQSKAITDEPAARAFLARQDPTLAAEAARSSISSGRWPLLLQQVLYGKNPQPPPAPSVLHTAVATYAAARPPETTGLFTLNFDLMLEEALRAALDELEQDSSVYSRPSTSPRAPHGSYEVNHLHGVVPPTDGGSPESVILTLSDFTGIKPPAWQLSALQDALQRGPLLIAGTSLRDPDIRQWIFDLTKGPGPHHQPTVLLTRAGMALSKPQFQKVQDAVIAQWRSIGVTPVLVHDYADAAQAIRELSAMNDASYRTPQERATDLLFACEASFDELQRVHAERLEHDQSILQEVLGQDANLTLWIADGDGHLLRWASPDRIYRGRTQLRAIPVGHDSPWVAGQCLAADDILAAPASPDPDRTRRWRSVVASPIVVDLPGGPSFSTAVLSSATAESLDAHDVDEWSNILRRLADSWGERLRSCVD